MKYLKCDLLLCHWGRVHGRNQEFVQGGGLHFFLFPGGAHHPLGPKNPQKSIDFTGPGGLSPHSPPPEYASALFTEKLHEILIWELLDKFNVTKFRRILTTYFTVLLLQKCSKKKHKNLTHSTRYWILNQIWPENVKLQCWAFYFVSFLSFLDKGFQKSLKGFIKFKIVFLYSFPFLTSCKILTLNEDICMKELKNGYHEMTIFFAQNLRNLREKVPLIFQTKMIRYTKIHCLKYFSS